jgi:hypothetical protein
MDLQVRMCVQRQACAVGFGCSAVQRQDSRYGRCVRSVTQVCLHILRTLLQVPWF